MFDQIKKIWNFATDLLKNKMYLLQLGTAIVIVVLNYLVGPFFDDAVILAIGTALAIPEPLWKLIVDLAKKLKKDK